MHTPMHTFYFLTDETLRLSTCTATAAVTVTCHCHCHCHCVTVSDGLSNTLSTFSALHTESETLEAATHSSSFSKSLLLRLLSAVELKEIAQPFGYLG